MSASIQKIIKQYLQYFYWFLGDKLNDDELDYMLYLRDRIHESNGDLGDLDSVWRANAKFMLTHSKVFNHPLSDAWWWKKSTWEKLTSKQHRSVNGKRKKSPRSITSK